MLRVEYSFFCSAANEPISQSSFWSHSWLNFGVEIIKENVLTHVLERHIAKEGTEEPTVRTVGGDSTEEGRPVAIDQTSDTVPNDSQVPVVLDNPCGQADHEHDYSSKYRLLCALTHYLFIYFLRKRWIPVSRHC